MITEITKYGKGYETPQGLEENKYYDLMYEFVDLAKVKGLTVRQAQKIFTDCADMMLDTGINSSTNLNEQSTESDMDRLIDVLSHIEETLRYWRLYNL